MSPSLNLVKIAQQTLQFLGDQLESQTDLDIDYMDNQLSIGKKGYQSFLLNFHAPTQQLWLSSPRTGAHHFTLQENKWVSIRTSSSLNTLLQEDLRHYFNVTADL